VIQFNHEPNKYDSLLDEFFFLYDLFLLFMDVRSPVYTMSFCPKTNHLNRSYIL